MLLFLPHRYLRFLFWRRWNLRSRVSGNLIITRVSMLRLAFEVDDFSQQRCCLCIFLWATESHHETLQGSEENVILHVILIFLCSRLIWSPVSCLPSTTLKPWPSVISLYLGLGDIGRAVYVKSPLNPSVMCCVSVATRLSDTLHAAIYQDPFHSWHDHIILTRPPCASGVTETIFWSS